MFRAMASEDQLFSTLLHGDAILDKTSITITDFLLPSN